MRSRIGTAFFVQHSLFNPKGCSFGAEKLACTCDTSATVSYGSRTATLVANTRRTFNLAICKQHKSNVMRQDLLQGWTILSVIAEQQ